MTDLSVQAVETTLAIQNQAPTQLVAALDPPLVLQVAPSAATLSVTVVQAGVLVAPAEQGPAGPKGDTGDRGPPGTLPTYTAGAVISGDKALMFSGANTVVHADPTADGYVYAGIATTAAQPGAIIQAIISGDVVASFWAWTPFAPVFVAPGGELTQAPPDMGRSHLVGWALDAQTIHLTPDPVIPIQ